MKKYAIFFLPVAAICLVGSLMIGGAVILVTVLTAGDVASGLPMKYFEFLSMPTLLVVLPVVGMLFLLISLPGILARRDAAKEVNLIEFAAKSAPSMQNQPSDQHLKAV